MHWLPLDIAPPFVRRHAALVGKRRDDGAWEKIEVWDSAWGREYLIGQGATHYCRVDRPPSPEEDEAAHDFIAITS